MASAVVRSGPVQILGGALGGGLRETGGQVLQKEAPDGRGDADLHRSSRCHPAVLDHQKFVREPRRSGRCRGIIQLADSQATADRPPRNHRRSRIGGRRKGSWQNAGPGRPEQLHFRPGVLEGKAGRLADRRPADQQPCSQQERGGRSALARTRRSQDGAPPAACRLRSECQPGFRPGGRSANSPGGRGLVRSKRIAGSHT